MKDINLMKNTIIVSCGKHSGGGGLTIVKQIMKLDPTIEYYHRDKNVILGKYFKDINELPESKNVIFLSHVTVHFDLFKKSVEKYKGSYLIHLQIDRIITKATIEETQFVSDNFNEVWHYSQSPTLYEGYGKSNDLFNLISNKIEMINIDINSYTFGEYKFKPLSEREKLIFTASRFGGFKQTPLFLKYFSKVVNESKFFERIPYFFYGLKYTFSGVTGKTIGEPGLISIFYGDIKNKILLPEFSVNDGFDSSKIVPNKLNTFTSYNEDDRKNWENYLVYIYTTMALSKEKPDKQNQIILDRYKPSFAKAIEYVVYEAIDAGVPVLFSKGLLESALPELLETEYYYEYVEDIPEILEKMISNEDDYKKLYDKQRSVLLEKSQQANNSIIEILNRIKKR